MAAALAGDSVSPMPWPPEDTDYRARRPGPVGRGDRLGRAHYPGDGPGGPLAAGVRPLDLGNSGTSMRFLTALAAPGGGRVTSSPAPPASARPLGDCSRPWARVGVRRGHLRERRRLPPGAGDGRPHRRPGAALRRHQQPVPLGPTLHRAPGPEGLEIEITGDLVSRPYVDLTLEVLSDFGITITGRATGFFSSPAASVISPRTTRSRPTPPAPRISGPRRP